MEFKQQWYSEGKEIMGITEEIWNEIKQYKQIKINEINKIEKGIINLLENKTKLVEAGQIPSRNHLSPTSKWKLLLKGKLLNKKMNKSNEQKHIGDTSKSQNRSK